MGGGDSGSRAILPEGEVDGSDGFSLDEVDLESDCEVILDVSPMVAEGLLGEFGYNDQGVAYGETWGRIYLPRGIEGEEDHPFPEAIFMDSTDSLP